MPVLKSAKHERFAWLMVFGEDAGNASACYTAVYGKQKSGARQTAYNLTRRPDIVSRLDELRKEAEARGVAAAERAIEKLGITQEWVLRKVKEDIEEAEEAGQYAVAIKGLELLGRHVGLFVSAGDTINNVLQIGVQLIDRPPDETFAQWQERRKRELTHKTIEHHTNGHSNGHANGNGKDH